MRKRRKRYTRIAGAASLALLIVAGAAFFNYQQLERQAARLPAPIRSQLTFSPFLIPSDAKGFSATDYRLSRPEPSVQLLTYKVSTESYTVTVSEYVQPPQFSDITEYRERFLANVIKQYATVQTANGSVYLGRQEKQANKQLAIMMERGLIVLMNPSRDLSENQWRKLGELLEIQKIGQ